MAAVTIQVIGGSGGLGASTFAAAVAQSASRRGARRVVLLDADPVRGLADHAAVLEHVAGLRWGELGALEGAVDGLALLDRLPREEGLSVLAGCGGPIPEATVQAVVESLHSTCDLLVVDGRGAALPLPAPPLAVLLAGVGPAEVEASRRVRAGLGETVVVTRGPRALRSLGPDIGQLLEAPWLGHLRDDVRVRRAAADGRPAASVRTVRTLSDLVLERAGVAA
jgi:predicted GTPase